VEPQYIEGYFEGLLVFELKKWKLARLKGELNLFTAKSQRTQRVRILFYPTVRGGRIKGSLSACGRDLHRLFASKRQKTFSLAVVSPPDKKSSFSLRPLHLCGKADLFRLRLCRAASFASAVRKEFVSIFLEMTT
jgi:hypothetical protein